MTPRVRLHVGAIGGRPGGSPAEALRRVQEAIREQKEAWVFRADVVQFFDRVPRARLFAQLRREVGSSVMCDLAEQLTLPPPTQPEGLVQGVPLSPLLANLYLMPLDLRLGDHRYVRFVDDVAAVRSSRSAASRARRQACGVVEALGLEVKDTDGRTSITRVGADPPPTFLGVELQGANLRVGLRRIRATMALLGEAERLVSCRCYEAARVLLSAESVASHYGFCDDPSIATALRECRRLRRLLPCPDGIARCALDRPHGDDL
jgi:hypothetical protein